jgi:hypothetical protein
MKRHFCDWNAGNPLDPRVKEAMRPFLEAEFGNPSSLHAEGRAARRAVENARASVAALAGVEPRDVVFTSGATESNHLAVTTFREGTVLYSAVEHPCMVAACEGRGGATRIPVTPSGDLDLEVFVGLLTPSIGGCAVMAANNETGIRLSLAEIGRRCALAEIPLHVDAAQVPGRTAFEWPEGATSAAFSAHKMGGPKGVGALVVRPGAKVKPLFRGEARNASVAQGRRTFPRSSGSERRADGRLPKRPHVRATSRVSKRCSSRLSGPTAWLSKFMEARRCACPDVSPSVFRGSRGGHGHGPRLGGGGRRAWFRVFERRRPSIAGARGHGRRQTREPRDGSVVVGPSQSEADVVDAATRAADVVRRVRAV